MTTVTDRIRNQAHRLYRRMQRQLLEPFSGKGIDARIVPDVTAVSPVLAQFEVIDMGRIPVPENKNKLVLGPVKRTHSGIVFAPDTELTGFAKHLFACIQHLPHMPPVHEAKYNCSLLTVRGNIGAGPGQEVGELTRAHLPAGHRKLFVLGFSAAANMAIDLDVIRRIGQAHLRQFSLLHQLPVRRHLRRITAIQPVLVETPDVTPSCNNRFFGHVFGMKVLVAYHFRINLPVDHEINLSCTKAGHFDVKPVIQQKLHLV